MASSKRDQLVDTALELFAQDGFHAVGIDRILTKAGVAKMTLYNHFKSKDELILATLRRRDERFRNWFMRSVERRAKLPRDRLLAAFDVLDEWFGEKGFSGCMFINAAAEYSDNDSPIRAAAAEHKRLITAYLRDLAAAAGATDPADLAAGLSILLDGATAARHAAGQTDAARRAKRMAGPLIAAALAGSDHQPAGPS